MLEIHTCYGKRKIEQVGGLWWIALLNGVGNFTKEKLEQEHGRNEGVSQASIWQRAVSA